MKRPLRNIFRAGGAVRALEKAVCNAMGVQASGSDRIDFVSRCLVIKHVASLSQIYGPRITKTNGFPDSRSEGEGRRVLSAPNVPGTLQSICLSVRMYCTVERFSIFACGIHTASSICCVRMYCTVENLLCVRYHQKFESHLRLRSSWSHPQYLSHSHSSSF